MTEEIGTAPANEILCKICHGVDSTPDNLLVSPCLCRGTLRHIHERCLHEYIKVRANNSCDICKYEIKFKKVYAEGTPSYPPLSCIAVKAFSNLWKVLLSVAKVSYIFSRGLVVLFVNGYIYNRFIFDLKSRSFLFVAFLAVLGTCLNFSHNFLFSLVRRLTSTDRTIRIDMQRSLETTVSDLASRSSQTGAALRDFELNSSNEDTTNDSSDGFTDEMAYYSYTSSDPFPIRTLPELSFEFLKMFYYIWPSLLIPILCYSHSLVGVLVSKATARFLPYLKEQGHGLLHHFLNMKYANTICIEFVCILTVIFILLIVESARNRVIDLQAKSILNFIKVYCLVVIFSFYIFVALGALTNFGVYLFINRGKPAFESRDFFAVLISHAAIGLVLNSLFDSWRDRLFSKFRPGITNLCHTNRVPSLHIKEFISMPIRNILIRLPLMVVVFTFFIFTTYYIQDALPRLFGYSLPLLHVSTYRTALFYHKVLSFAFFETEDLIITLSSVHVWVTRKIAPLFSMQNYIFNEKMPIPDKQGLVWGMNRTVFFREDALKVQAINSSLHDSNKDSYNKYAITDKRIEKYYGKTHKRNISIFYKPKHAWAFFLTIVAMYFLVTQALLGLLILTSLYISSWINMARDIALLLSLLVAFRAFRLARLGLRAAANSLMLYLYTDLIWPTTAAVIYICFMSGSTRIFYTSQMFMVFFSISSYLYKFCQFNIFPSLNGLPIRSFLRKLLGFYFWKIILAFTYSFYWFEIGFKGLIAIVVMMALGILIILSFRALFINNWLERVKDEYFLERSIPVNYDSAH